MKILFISMPSLHAVRWIENLNGSGHDLYWFDVLGKGKLPTKISIKQMTNWKDRKLPYIKGEYFLRKKIPILYNKFQTFLEVTANEKLEQILLELKPDLVHSFEMQNCSYSIFKTMKKFLNVKWLYSCWGSDLYYYQNQTNHLLRIKAILNRINYLHTDCGRDYNLAILYGFKGKFLGIIPGGGGYKLKDFKISTLPLEERKIILVKGYQHVFGRSINIIKALEKSINNLQDYKIIIFGSHVQTVEYIIKNRLPFKTYDKDELTQNQLMELMGKSLLYIGNSISDGMPNTLLEAIIMGAFPIQANPGGATAEIIKNKINGLLIENPEDFDEIKNHIEYAVNNIDMIKSGINLNKQIAVDALGYEVNNAKILAIYDEISKS